MEPQDKHEVEKRGRYKNIDNERIAAVFAKKGCNIMGMKMKRASV